LTRAHAAAYRVYVKEFAAIQGGKVGITLNINWGEPVDNGNPDDLVSQQTYMQFNLGWFAHPIFVDGNYPEVMRNKIDEKSLAQGYPESRLPHFTHEEQGLILGSSDFLGLNIYTSFMVYGETSDINDVDFYADQDLQTYQDETWYDSGASWLKITPWGIRESVRWAWDTFNNPDIYITENGYSSKYSNLDDLQRVYYLKHYINQVLKTITVDGISVKGYYAWSLMDVFEWTAGYTEKFGIHRVNMSDPARERTKKLSANFYSTLVRRNGFVPDGDIC